MRDELGGNPLEVLRRWIDEAGAAGVPEPGAVEREFEAAAASDRDAAMPDSWTTIRLAPARMDFWQAGTETTPPGRTRFVAEGPTWCAFPVLP